MLDRFANAMMHATVGRKATPVVTGVYPRVCCR
jgi:hypothetical protein